MFKAQEEGLITPEEVDVIYAIYAVRDAHLHWNPHMRTVKSYGEALRKFGLEISDLSKDLKHIASKPIADAILGQTESLFQSWTKRAMV